MKPYAKVPLLAKPNAGLPKLVDGRTVFDMGAEEFGTYVAPLVSAGVNMIGGCCGTSPEYIEQIRKNITGLVPVAPAVKAVSALTSTRKTLFIDSADKFLIIGDRINPAAEKNLQDELKEGEIYEVQELAAEQVQNGADILNINVELPGTDETESMKTVVEFVGSRFNVPICIDSSSPEAIEKALRIYPGRALIRLIPAGEEKTEKLLSIAAKYGAMFILIPVDDKEAAEEAGRRCEIVERVYNEAIKYGFEKDDIVVDCLVKTEESDQKCAADTLKLIKWCKDTFGFASVISLSDISSGLPESEWTNPEFLAKAMGEGLTMAILNPSPDVCMEVKKAFEELG